MPSRLAVLASGRGSNLQAIMDHFDSIARERVAKVVLVASNRSDSPALIRAATASIDIASFDASDDGTELLDLLRRFRVDLVVLAGYLKRIPPLVIREYAGRIINIHPALLPAFGGEGMGIPASAVPLIWVASIAALEGLLHVAMRLIL